MVRKNFVGLESALMENVKTKAQLRKSDFESAEDWSAYAGLVKAIREALSEGYACNFIGGEGKEAMNRFYAGYKALLLKLTDNGSRYMAGSFEQESARYGIIAAKVQTVKVDTEASCAYYDEYVKPIAHEYMMASYLGAPKAEKDEIIKRLHEAQKAQNELKDARKDIGDIGEGSFRKQFEAILGTAIAGGTLKTAAQHDLERKAKSEAKKAEKKAFLANMKGE